MWNTGCQVVALNYQTPCFEMMQNQALFRTNGGTGYVLKPPYAQQPNKKKERKRKKKEKSG
jgi:phosphatidylinositol phospholipase C delta